MQLFVMTTHCTSRTHCSVCREKEKGRNWRQSISKIYELPKVDDGKNPLDFECPFGLGWKEDPKINNIKSVDINSKVKISRDAGSRNARDCNCSRNKK